MGNELNLTKREIEVLSMLAIQFLVLLIRELISPMKILKMKDELNDFYELFKLLFLHIYLFFINIFITLSFGEMMKKNTSNLPGPIPFLIIIKYKFTFVLL